MRSVSGVSLLTPRVSLKSIARLTDSGMRVLVEEPATGPLLEKVGRGPYETVENLVPTVPDLNDPALAPRVERLLGDLAAALQASRWNYAGVSLWDVVSVDFLLYHLDGLLQAAEVAKRLLAITGARRVCISAFDTPLARALAAFGRAQGLSVEVVESRQAVVKPMLRACVLPYFGHVREWATAWRQRVGGTRTGGSPFVFVNHSARNALTILPLLEGLGEQIARDRAWVLQVGQDGAGLIREHGFAHKYFAQYVSLHGGLRALRAVAPVVRFLVSGQWRRAAAQAKLRWDGVPLSSLAEQEISFGLARLLCNAARMVACARTMLEKESPSLVVLTNDRADFGRAIGLGARAAGVPSMLVQFGLTLAPAHWHPGVAADLAAVQGEAPAEVIRNADNHPGLQISVTGQPKHDVLLRKVAMFPRAQVCDEYGLDPRRPIVLYASHALGEQSSTSRRGLAERRLAAREVEAVYRTMAELKNVELVVKPHPNEDVEPHNQVLKKVSADNIRLVQGIEPIEALLSACDVLVTHHSTVGLEAVLLGKPLVIVNLSGRPDPFPYVRCGVAVGAYQDCDIASTIEAALFDPPTREGMAASRPAFLRRHAFRGAVPATERVVAVALALARDGGIPKDHLETTGQLTGVTQSTGVADARQ